MGHGLSLLFNYTWSKSYDDLPQATRVSNTEDLNAGESYVYPPYPSNAVGIPAAARVNDIKALDRGAFDIDHPMSSLPPTSTTFPRCRQATASSCTESSTAGSPAASSSTAPKTPSSLTQKIKKKS
jgi:hypothetical protein